MYENAQDEAARTFIRFDANGKPIRKAVYTPRKIGGSYCIELIAQPVNEAGELERPDAMTFVTKAPGVFRWFASYDEAQTEIIRMIDRKTKGQNQ